MKNDDEDLSARRRRERSIVMALILGAFVILMFLITLSRIRQGMGG